ncbi:MAG TPA: hypothetical protein VKH81_04390 [Candidatus Angelobacter sp.]|nr:hypothetical protein [Candidatus Angelobacter sp.]
MTTRPSFLLVFFIVALHYAIGSAEDLSGLKRKQPIADFRVANLYSDSDGKIVGGKFWHNPSGAPVYIFQIETVPQAFMWVDAPVDSNNGVAHALEHLLPTKGQKGRYVTLLTEMRLSRRVEASYRDYNFYSFSSGSGMPGFFEQFHAWLDALYKPNFTNLEVEREFYHFGVATEPSSHKRTLVEQGAVYNEMLGGQDVDNYYLQLRRQVFGAVNPFAFEIGGVPDEMRQLKPEEIRKFYEQHYRLGPGTGFIFVIDPKENVAAFLRRISEEFRHLARQGAATQNGLTTPGRPKYPISPMATTEIELYPFPSTSESERGEVCFAWKAVKTDSRVDLKLLQLFFGGLSDGEQSLLYKELIDSKTREFESGATNVETWAFLENSPHFPVEFIGIHGVPGNQITVASVERIRKHVLNKIEEIAGYADNSPALAAFNQLVATQIEAQRRSENISIKSAPLFGMDYNTDWKERLGYLEMDPSYVQSLSDTLTWEDAERRIKSGKNIWRDLIRQFHLSDVPYATGSVPSPRLVREIEAARQKRAEDEEQRLMARFGVKETAEALRLFEKEETAKTDEINKIDARVRQPQFTNHPPLTLDDDIRYKQFRIDNVPVIAALFDRAPTIDVGLSFDLQNVPEKYYKYLPIFPRCLDSLGLKKANTVTFYPDLLAETQKDLQNFSVAYEYSAFSGRADLTVRASAISAHELQTGLSLIERMLHDSYLDVSNSDRLRDLASQRLARDDGFRRRNGSTWFQNPAYVLRYQDRPLFVALHSFFTQAHWNDRFRWLVHKPVTADEIHRLDIFAKELLASSSGLTVKEFADRLSQSNAKDLQRELVEYWQRNIASFADNELLNGLQTLTKEVEEDLRQGPSQTIEDLKELQQIVLSRRTVKVDVTLDPVLLEQVRPILDTFLKSLPEGQQQSDKPQIVTGSTFPIMAKAAKRYGMTESSFPWYLSVADPASSTASLMFSAEFPGYSQVDRESLLQVLGSKLISGAGPHTVYMKALQEGLAYNNAVSSDPGWRLIWYSADRSPDLVGLISLVNAIADKIPSFRDPVLVDYALHQTFPVPRSLSSFSDRGKGLAKDIYDGNDPQAVARFSEAILRLRKDPDLLSEITHTGLPSVASVLLASKWQEQQRSSRSIFFFVGPERLLHEAEQNLPIPKLLRLYPSDFWIGSPEGSVHAWPAAN